MKDSTRVRELARLATAGRIGVKVPVTLGAVRVPDDFLIENGYAEACEDLYRAPNGVYEGRAGVRYFPTTDRDEVLFHFLGGSRAPQNHAKDSVAGRQWTYTGKGRKAADRDLFVREITRAPEPAFAVVGGTGRTVLSGASQDESEAYAALHPAYEVVAA